MKIILLKDIRNVGRKDEVKEVANGFASNFLLPQNFAVVATPEKVRALEKIKEAQSQKIAAQEAVLDDQIRSLMNQKIEIAVRTTPKGGLFKSITAADIACAIKEQKKAEIPESTIILSEPIKTIGEHTVKLQSKNTRAEMIFSVTANL